MHSTPKRSTHVILPHSSNDLAIDTIPTKVKALSRDIKYG